MAGASLRAGGHELSEQGHFTWKEWAAALAAELKAAADRGEPDDGSRYYDHWLAALERLVTEKGLIDPAAIAARKEAWAEAYRRTPHGKPVELARRRAQDRRALETRSCAAGLGSRVHTWGQTPRISAARPGLFNFDSCFLSNAGL